MPEPLRISQRERTLLTAMQKHTHDLGWGWSFQGLSHISDLPLGQIRRTVRSLARKGLAQFQRVMWAENGQPVGAGYALTPEGRQFGKEWEASDA
jgi:hypothetical protein